MSICELLRLTVHTWWRIFSGTFASPSNLHALKRGTKNGGAKKKALEKAARFLSWRRVLSAAFQFTRFKRGARNAAPKKALENAARFLSWRRVFSAPFQFTRF